jgi:hypothetical protein
MSDVDCSSERDGSSASGIINAITEEMIAAGMTVYKTWESDHIFEGAGGAAPYAIRELVRAVYVAMKGNSPDGA